LAQIVSRHGATQSAPTQTASRHTPPTRGGQAAPASASDDYFYGALSESALIGSLDVLDNDPNGATLYAVHSSQPGALGNVRHGGTIGAPKAAVTVVHDGVTYTGYASVGANGEVKIDFSGAGRGLDSLGAGEQLTGSFFYTAKLPNGKFSAAEVTFTITGENDGATITGQSAGTVTEDGTLSASGTLVVQDADDGQAAFQSPGSLAGTYGNFTFNAATGAWTYTLNNESGAVQDLDDGDVVYDTLTVTSLDGTASQTITVTINGAYDEPALYAFITGETNPWGRPQYDESMNTAFGEGNWDKFNDTTYENIFDDGYEFIWLDGSDENTDWLVEYLDLHAEAIESYVSDGGHLWINAARNEHTGEDIDLGFGVTLVYGFADNGYATEDADDLVDGENGNAGSSWTGSSFAHDYLTGDGLEDATVFITSEEDGAGNVLLAGMAYGDGYVMFGGLTSAYFHNPDPQADILEANILDYVHSFYGAEVVPTFA